MCTDDTPSLGTNMVYVIRKTAPSFRVEGSADF